MNRATPFALGVLLALVGCGSPDVAPQAAMNSAAAGGNDEVEALPSDGLAAPEGMPLDSESNTVDGVGEADGGNAGGGNAL